MRMLWRRCTNACKLMSDLKTLAENMSCKQTKAKYTIEALLYKPLDRVTKTTLVLHDLLKHTPEEHLDYPLLQEALRISSSFLSVVNEEVPNKKSTVTLSKGKVRQLVKDGFLVDFSNGNRSFRHIFLFTDLILCAKLKQGKHPHYRFDWYLPVSGLTVRCGQECNIPSCYQLRMKDLKQKIFLLRRNIQQEKRGSKILAMRTCDRAKKKLLEYESWMLTHSPTIPLELHSRYGKNHTLLLSSLYELYEWKDCIEKLTGESFEKISVDLLKLTSSCVKLRSVHHPPSSSFTEENTDKGLCGTLSVMVHSATEYQKPANTYISLELDSFGYFENRGQTRVLMDVSEPIWEEEFSLEVDGAHYLRLLCVQQQETGESLTEDKILGRTQVELEANFIQNKWRRMAVTLNEIQVSVSLKYSAHGLQPPGSSCTDQSEVFGVLLGITAEREGVLVPNLVRYCVEEIDRRGLEEVGIYRISGIATEIQALRTAFNTNLQDAISRLKTVDVNAVSGTLKLYFRELPEPLIPPEFFQPLARGLEVADKEKKECSMIDLLQEIPDANRNTFLFLVQHLKRVSEKKDVNKMTIHNLATVFGPSLLRPPKDSQSDAVDISQEVVVQVQVVFYYLQSNNLPAPQTRRKTYTESEET
uniref:Active breakpoint cluster region-related protein-like n=1 Tax=Erpetoichthys calabaricus TaxID=27687 RepID=A0A8C4RR04_ERPCA